MKKILSTIVATLLICMAIGTFCMVNAAEELEPNFVFHTESVSEADAKYETLAVGSRGEAVVKLQQALIDKGFLDGAADGDYGNGTAGAVTKFQESVGLTANGTADSVTQEMAYDEYVEPEVDIAEVLQNETWVFNGGEDFILNGISFTDKAATIAQVYFDGNGKHTNESNVFEYEITDDCIKLVLMDGSEMEIPYEVKNGKLVLNNGEWKTVAEVKAGLQGNWAHREFDDFTKCTFEYRTTIQGDMFYSENANSNGFYFGPYEGSFTLNFGGFDAEFKHAGTWFYSVIDGDVVLLRYDKVFERTDTGLVGQYGYSF